MAECVGLAPRCVRVAAGAARFAPALFAVSFIASGESGCAVAEDDWTIVNGSFIDVVSGTVRANGAIVVEDGVVTAVLPPEDDAPSVGATFDATGKVIMPGLWEAHGHLVEQDERGSLTVLPRAWEYHRGTPYKLDAFLEHGITTVRDPGGSIDSLEMRNEDVEGPRLYAAGKLFVAKGGYPTHSVPEYLHDRALYQVEDLEDARRFVDEAARELDGVDFVKVVYTSGVLLDGEYDPETTDPASVPAPWLQEAPLMRREVLRAIIERAHELGLRVSVHTDRFSEARDAVDEGADYLHHAWPIPDDEVGAAFLATMAAREVCWNVILNVMASRAPALLPSRIDAVSRAFAAGVPITAGTDTGSLGSSVPWGESLLFEMELLEVAGLSPMDVLRATTTTSARCLGRGDRGGSIEVGKEADLLALSADPTRDLSLLRPDTIEAVWVGGVRLR